MKRQVNAKRGLNVRQFPGFHNIVATLAHGSVVEVLEAPLVKAEGYDWVELLSPVSGFVAGKFLRDYQEPQQVQPFEYECWPTEFPFFINQGFGENPDWYKRFYGPGVGHQGIDFYTVMDGKIFCVAPGTVSMVHTIEDWKKSGHNFGAHVRVKHVDGHETIYAHASETLVVPGESVLTGHVLMLAGVSGNATGVHLHLHHKHNGKVVNPENYFRHLLPEG